MNSDMWADIKARVDDAINEIDFSELSDCGMFLDRRTKVWPGHTIVTYPFYDDLQVHSDIATVQAAISQISSAANNLYVHVPFCNQICHYCAYSRSTGGTESRHEAYVKAHGQEMGFVQSSVPEGKLAVTSIYIGGGTPTALSLRNLESLLQRVFASVNLESAGEVSCEVSPETILAADGREKLNLLKALGINRISMGVETFDSILAKEVLHRGHGGQEAELAVAAIFEAGFSNVNLDLIYSLPTLTLDQLKSTCETVVKTEVPSITLYPYRQKDLSIWNKRLPVDEKWSQELELQQALSASYYFRELGFTQDSVNWFVKGEKPFRQQQMKYTMKNLVGTGCSSYSFINSCQFFNTFRELDYVKLLNRGHNCMSVGRKLTSRELLTRYLIFGIKRCVSTKDAVSSVGDLGYESIKPLNQLVAMGLVDFSNETWTLSDLGKPFADEVGLYFHRYFSSLAMSEAR